MKKGKKVAFPGVEVGFPFDFLKEVKGLPGYALRGLTLNVYLCFLRNSNDKRQREAAIKLHEFLRSHGLGAQKLIFGEYGADLDQQLITQNINGIDIINPFYVGPASPDIFPEEWFGRRIPSLQASFESNSKIWLRKHCNRSVFPHYRIIRDSSDAEPVIRNVLRNSSTGKILIKEDGGASGSGITTFSRVDPAVWHAKDVLLKLKECNRNPEIIIEEKRIKIVDGSIRVVVPRIGEGGPYVKGLTKQYVDGEAHLGNIITSNGRIPDFSDDVYLVWDKIKGAVDAIQRLGYWGYVTIDFFIDLSGNVWVAEVNARMTASYFLDDLCDQISRKYPDTEFAIASYNCTTPGVDSFDKIMRVIGDDVFDGRFGVFPNLMAFRSKTGIIVVGPDYLETENKMFQVKNRIERS
ncbi:hypothetical protein ACFL2R_03135 [Patescibacteria group bacterium]